jgi:hypothetical protein
MFVAENRLHETSGGDLARNGAPAPSSELLKVDPVTVQTGMLWCPPRLSHIGIMRCAQYQFKKGCGIGCPNAATKAEIKLIAARSSERVEIEERIDRVFCTVCGNPKKSRQGLHCKRCAGRIAARWRQRGSAPEQSAIEG